MSTGQQVGVSIALCCHNSARLLPRTLEHLKVQRVSAEVFWEVLVVDNASTDDTAEVARQCWGADVSVPMRVVKEPRLGLSYARERAFREARYQIVSFVDDDNWITDDWISTVNECMVLDPQLAAIGSRVTTVADVPLPKWFGRYSQYYGELPFSDPATISTWFLIGAGMTIRKSAWYWLNDHGFRSRLTDRRGSRLSTGGDLELGFALRLAGWKIRLEPRLRVKHYMTERRLKWRYLRRLLRSNGEANVVLDSYILAFQSQQRDLLSRLRQVWWVRLAKETVELGYRFPPWKIIGALLREMESDDAVAAIELRAGRLIGLLRLRAGYGELRKDVARAQWRKIHFGEVLR